MENCGIYKIVNIVNNKCYIGSSKNIKKRWYEHKRRLRKGTHHSEYLQRSFNKYGEENFIFKVLELCEPSELLVFEQRYFDEIKPEYIILKTAGRVDGYRHTEKTKQIIREKRALQISSACSDETKQKISNANKNRVFTDEHKEKLSQAHIGKKLSDEHRKKIGERCTSETMREMQKLSTESRKKNGNYIVSDKQKSKIIEANSKGLIGINDNGDVIYSFSSHREAHIFFGISEGTLYRNLKKEKFKELTWKKV